MTDTWIGSSLSRNGVGAGPAKDPSDAQMEQIRELLFGGIREEMLSRLAALERRVGVLEQSLAAARQEDDIKRRAAFDSLSTAVADLGIQIRHLARP